MTVYPVIGEPPSLAGAFHETFAPVDPDGAAIALRGGPGAGGSAPAARAVSVAPTPANGTAITRVRSTDCRRRRQRDMAGPRAFKAAATIAAAIATHGACSLRPMAGGVKKAGGGIAGAD